MTTRRARRAAAETPLPLVKRLLGTADDTEVLVGGQALSAWIVKYALQLPPDLPVVTRDIGFLTQSAGARSPVEKFARAINGRASFPHRLKSRLANLHALREKQNENGRG